MATPKNVVYPIITKDGVDYVDPIGGGKYLVKVFEAPEYHNLSGMLKLLESFERRFLHTVEGGHVPMRYNSAELDTYIEEKRKAYAAATGGEKELEGAALCIAILERGLRLAKKHITHRIKHNPPDAAVLKALHERVDADLVSTSDYFKHVRRKRGHMDVDDVLGEMRGEPYFIYMATLTDKPDTLTFFLRNRLSKAASAMRCIDRMAEAVEPLVQQPPLAEAGAPAMLKELAEAAKLRVQLMREDPDFSAADRRLTVAHHALQALAPPKPQAAPAHLPASHPAKQGVSPTTLALVKEAADMMLDTAIIRVQRNVSAADLAARVQEHQPMQAPTRKAGAA
ncbi:MAG: hypothetical protein K2Q01_11190 [Rickettsiales bacterium]|nr:hypothetical protein [Rickettsiales bacterium]